MSRLSADQAMQLAITHHHAGRLREAEAIYRQILSVLPKHPEVLHLLGLVAGQQGRLDEAVDLIGKAIAAAPGNPSCHFNFGIFLEKLNQLDAAIDSYQRAINCKPDYVEAHIHLGNAWRAKRETDRAAACYEQALSLRPDFIEAHISLGNIWNDRGEPDRAIACFRRALELHADHPQAKVVLANTYIILGKTQADPDAAIAAFKQALQFQPDEPRAHFSLANAWNLKELPDEAIPCYQRAIACYEATDPMNPDLPRALCMLGHALNKTGESAKAMDAFNRAIAHDPDSRLASDLRLYNLIFDPAKNSAGILAESLEWNRRFALSLKPANPVYANNPNPDRPLRIGYVSADFHRHVANHFMLPLLASHDRNAVEIFCYANVKTPDEITEKMMAVVPTWRDIANRSDDTAAEMIRQDQIDILVDLNLHTADNRLLLFARKPAPVQATWLGYPGTTGLQTIDYRLTDPYLDPPGADESCYSEKPFRLPETFWCYDPLEDTTFIKPSLAVISGKITFGCLNDTMKVNKHVLDLWARLLKTIGDSRLLLLAPPGNARDRIHRHMAANGIDPQRADFVARQPRILYLETYNQIDISLDTFPCNGHTTSLDSMWMGVPVITLAGKTLAGRAGVSQLSNLGLTELIAHSPDQYVQIANDLANDFPRLSALRSSLRERLERSPLMDQTRFARAMEDACRAMWKHWCENRRAET